MSGWTIKDERKPRELVPDDSYYGHCIGLYDIGTQPAFKQGDRPQRQVVLEWALHNTETHEPVRKKDGTIATISAFVGMHIGRTGQGAKTKLREYVEAMFGTKFSDEECKKGVDIGGVLETVSLIDVERAVDKTGKVIDPPKQKVVKLTAVKDKEAVRKVKLAAELDADSYLLEPGKPIPEYVPKWLHSFIERSAERMGGSESEEGEAPAKPAARSRRTEPEMEPVPARGRRAAEPEDEDDDIAF